MISLNGEWEVSVDGKNYAEIKVPGELIMQGVELGIGETARYRRDLLVPKDWKDHRVFIRFDGVSSYASVKINDTVIGDHEGSFVPFEFEITQALNSDRNVLTVDVKAHTISDILACTSQYAAHTVAGILRKVTLFTLPQVHVADLSVQTFFDEQYQNARLQLTTQIAVPSPTGGKLQLRYTLLTADGKKVKETVTSLDQQALSNGLKANQTLIKVNRPRHWNPETPYLYTLTTELLQNGDFLQRTTQRIGFRQVEVRQSRVYVNGRSIKLHGVNRHAVHPITGRSLSPELDRLDARLFKEANCNYIRTSHYPPSDEFLQAADELGLFVESEASLTWIEHHASPIWGHWDYTDKKFFPYFLQANLDQVQANKNHPSVIIWSLANESRWSALWNDVNAVIKNLDSSRPTSFHDQCWGGFNNAGSTADIANYHYPGINGPAATTPASRPVLFGEYAHLSTYNRREILTDPGVRDAYNQPLVMFYDSIYTYPNNLGGAIWSGIDDSFHLPDGRIVGYGPWGPIDGWRRKKPEYFGMKKAYSPVKVKNVKTASGKLQMEVENRYDFTALSDIQIQAVINGEEVAVKSDIGPRQSGLIEILYEGLIHTVGVTFFDPNGFVAEEEYYDLSEKQPVEAGSERSLALSEHDNVYLIRQGEITYTISKITGIVVSAEKDGQEVFTTGPQFTVMPMNSENGGKNNIAGETYQRIIHPIQSWPWYLKFASAISVKESENSIDFDVETTFKEGKGHIRYQFSSDGMFTTDYEISAGDQELRPYQYGLLLQLPKTFDQLSWKRNGDFTVYPADHIGRNVGIATLNSKVTNGVEPWRERPLWPWKDDATEMGSNDFRSTKRFIERAALSNGKGITISVLSDGKQASRTWLQEEQINWLIADYFNNGSEPFYGTPHNNGRITMKDQVAKGKLILFIE
ncbi:MAG: hypothetical protein KDD15_03955 [Lewinella sp.]|nr:hypothetical protein [Lewinella sp.]